MDEIKIRGLEISACHGVKDFEKIDRQPFIFDADIKTSFFAAAQTDDLNLTVNYSKICALITEITQGNTFALIEKLAYECAFAIFERFERVEGVSLTVWKPKAPMKRKFENVGVSVSLKREKAYLSLGSSMGDRQGYINKALKLLSKERGITVLKVSDCIETAPYGGVAQNGFLNCAAAVSVLLTPHNLLDVIHKIESACERDRKERWGDRTLDIDIVFFGDKKVGGLRPAYVKKLKAERGGQNARVFYKAAVPPMARIVFGEGAPVPAEEPQA